MADNRCILVVEDDEAILESVKELLEDTGYTVQTARDGLEALKLLRSGKKLPAVILLDLMMPLMDGYKFREEQESDPKISKIPILIMTADGQIQSKQFKIGAQGFVKKPFEIPSLLTEIKRYCG